MDINITDYFFKVCFKTNRTQDINTPATGGLSSHAVPLEPDDEFSLALWLPSYVISGCVWTAVGNVRSDEGEDDEDLIGFDETSPVIRKLPMLPGVVYDCTFREVFEVKLITARHNFELVFEPFATSIHVEHQQVYYYVRLRETDLGRGLSCKFNVCTQRGASTINIDQDFSHFFGRMRDVQDVLIVPAQTLNQTNPDCSICLMEMSGNCRSMRCSHTFCADCIIQWLRTRFTCPICRALP